MGETAVEPLFTYKDLQQLRVLHQGFAEISAKPEDSNGIVQKEWVRLDQMQDFL